jgi:type IV pilus assembly protein PilA
MNDALPSSQLPPQPEPAKTAAKKGNGLAVTGVVFASLFFLPIIPLVGLILGIVTLATGRNKTLGIVAICLGGFFTMFVGIEAAIAIPAFMKYVRRSKTVEATMNVRRLATAVAVLPPDEAAKLSSSEWTPPGRACDGVGGKFGVDASLWNAEPWKTLDFAVETPAYYQYRVRRDGDGFTVEAQGDLDCDGIFSHFERHVGPSGAGDLRSQNDIE